MSYPKTTPSTPAFKNSSSFRATGRGYANRVPDTPATTANANAIFVNLGLPKGDPNRQLPLFVYGIQTGFELSGTYGQSAGARTFYPHNLTQDGLTISCIVPNQYEYDRLVEFVKIHQQTAISSWTTDPNGGQGSSAQAMQFYLRPWIKDGVTLYGGMPGAGQVGPGNGSLVEGYIQTIEAGAERFQNVRTYDIPFMISHDYMDEPLNVTAVYNRQLLRHWMKSFNQFYGRTSTGALIPVSPNAPHLDPTTSAPPDYWTTVVNPHATNLPIP